MTPYTLGISSGAVLGAGIAIKLGLGSIFFGIAAISLFGFLGAMITVFLLIYLSQFLRSSQQESLLLLGIALSLFYTSALMIIFYLGDTMQNDMLIRFTMGSLSVIGWNNPLLLGVITFTLFLSIYLYRFELQLLSISEALASLKGVNAKKVTLILLMISSFSASFIIVLKSILRFFTLLEEYFSSNVFCQIDNSLDLISSSFLFPKCGAI